MRIKWTMAVSKPEFWEDLTKEGWSGSDLLSIG